jgi:hypothetical protein
MRRIKQVTRFLTFIVRSLKLETHLWKDFVIAFPALPADAVPLITRWILATFSSFTFILGVSSHGSSYHGG